MAHITQSPTREIVSDFAKEIRTKRRRTVKPSKTVINFRTDIKDGVERDVWRVPIEILRYRKDNGRIASDVLDYEKNVGILHEADEDAQAKIAEFLKHKDPEKTNILRKSLLHDGQREPAIITCDGFLINGNRRKMVMEELRREFPDNQNFEFMKVVILPGPDDPNEGGPPTLLEIESIENRYQLQSDGKSEYYGFDRALSIKRKIEIGLSLEAQLRDDPRFAEVARVSSIVEGEAYMKTPWATQTVSPVTTRLEEIINFAKKMGYRKLGVAFCGGLMNEAKILIPILENRGFDVVSVCCKTGGIPKEEIGVKDEEKIIPGRYETMCNPIAQAEILNDEKTDFNIVMGLCVGHDALFLKHVKALTTVFVVKDRLLGHNPIVALYQSSSYYRRLRASEQTSD